MTGATDARNYEEIAEHVVRFAPVIYGPEQMKGMHGLNENIEYNCLPGAVDFYKDLIRANAPTTPCLMRGLSFFKSAMEGLHLRSGDGGRGRASARNRAWSLVYSERLGFRVL